MRLFCGSDDKNQEPVRTASLINALVATVPCCSVASVHKRLLASGIERARSSVQKLMKAEHWPAKQVICVEFLLSLPFLFCGPPTGEESAPEGAEQAAAWSGVLQRLREAKGLLMQDTHFSKFPAHSPHCVKSHYQRSSRRSLSYSFTHFDRSFSGFMRVRCMESS